MSVVHVEIEGDIGWVTVNNPPVNATSTAVRAGLLDAVGKVQGARLAVLNCAGKTFIAGGDMSEFDRPAEEPHLPDVVNAIEASETPFLALMHGNVLGGGFEIAMACAYRVAAPGTRFGLPEVNVGLIPGAGGTQRAPRLLGWDAAISMACEGKMLRAEELLELGAIDAVETDLRAAAVKFDQSRPVAVSDRVAPELDTELLETKTATIRKRAKGQRSPLLNLEALQWAQEPFHEGQPKERARHLELRHSDESKALRHFFFAEREVARPKAIAGGAPKDIQSVAVVGGGLMGAGIAVSFLNAGLAVKLIERDDASAQSAEERVLGLLQGALKRVKITQQKFDAQSEAFSTHSDYAAAADVDLAIEAVFEDVAVKKQVFAELAAVTSSDTILATNTSYLDPDLIFERVEGLDRCVGLHFFSPAHIMKLVEVVKLPESSKETLATAFALSKRLRKVAVLSGICDGFIGNRILAAYRRAAEYMLADGALPEQIDAAMRNFGFAMGPFEAQDMGGLQIAEANRRRQDATRDPSERYIEIADQLCAEGRLGQRAGKGWFRYEEGDRRPHVDPEVTTLIEAYSVSLGITRTKHSEKGIQQRLLAVLANEGARIVEEGIAENEAAVDIVKVFGYGFPRWRGGPMQAANAMGVEAIKDALSALEFASPGSWVRAKKFT